MADVSKICAEAQALTSCATALLKACTDVAPLNASLDVFAGLPSELSDVLDGVAAAQAFLTDLENQILTAEARVANLLSSIQGCLANVDACPELAALKAQMQLALNEGQKLLQGLLLKQVLMAKSLTGQITKGQNLTARICGAQAVISAGVT